MTEQNNSTKKSFFIAEEVNKRKDIVLKTKCEGAIKSIGLSNEKFYDKAEISRQQWYVWSWGLEPFPSYIKIKFCDLFGKPFRDLFLQEGEK